MSNRFSLWILVFFFLLQGGFAVDLAALAPPLEGSAEDLFWSEPITVHDFKKKNDLHNIGVSVMSLAELEFVRLGDGLLYYSLRKRNRPIAKSLDSLEYAYHELPQITPVHRAAQLVDAFQIRQLSLSDLRLIHSFLSVQKIGGITPIMQTRIYKILVVLEDLIEDLDRVLMWPVNRRLSAVRKTPVRVKTLSYASDGLGYGRWKVYSGVRWMNKKMVLLGSDLIHGVEEVQDAWIRKRRIRKNRQALIYSRMPLDVYRDRAPSLTGGKKASIAGTLEDWHELVRDEKPLQDRVTELRSKLERRLAERVSGQVIVASEYETWAQVPAELRRYVIERDELAALIRRYQDLKYPPKKEAAKLDFAVTAEEARRNALRASPGEP